MSGYFRHPDIDDDRIVFTSEDDLWRVHAFGGRAERLTKTRGTAVYPCFSPDGEQIAFTGTEEGTTEVFVVEANGGQIEQLTYTGTAAAVVGWTPDGESIVFRSNFKEPFRKTTVFYAVPREGGEVQRLDIGRGKFLSYEPEGDGLVIARHEDDLARWKRYRGGRAGQLWIDPQGEDEWEQLLANEDAGKVRPHWIGDRIYFLSDMEGYSNLYVLDPDSGKHDRLTDHTGHYARFLRSDGNRLVYTKGGDLYVFDVESNEDERLDVEYHGSKTELNRKFVSAANYLQSFEPHPEGDSLCVSTRGKLFHFGNWEGAVYQKGKKQGVRYRLPTYIDDERILSISDAGGEEAFEIFEKDREESVCRFDDLEADMGRPLKVKVDPDGERVAFTNHRYEIFILDLEDGELEKIDQSSYSRISGLDWSPNGDFLAFAFPNSKSTSEIWVYDLEEDEVQSITQGQFVDTNPVFDPKGRYLYFLSRRDFNPVYDEVFFEASFPQTTKPFVVTLNSEQRSPFHEKPRPLGDGRATLNGEEDEENGVEEEGADKESDEEQGEKQEVEDDEQEEKERDQIDFDYISERIESFPVEAARYRGLAATENRVFWNRYSAQGRLNRDDEGNSSGGALRYYSLKKNEESGFAKKVRAFTLDENRKSLVYWTGSRLRILKAGGGGASSKSGKGNKPGRESGWVDLSRLSVGVEPRAEWKQMLREAWRLMRDHYWHEQMGDNDWEAIWEQYSDLLSDVSTRSEFSDLVWTMQGELGTSHAYEMGGDYETPPQYRPGFLGADFRWDPDVEHEDVETSGGYEIRRIVRGQGWESGSSSPLVQPGVRIEDGDILVSINGRALEETDSIQEALVNEAGKDVDLTVIHTEDDSVETYTVEALKSEFRARYRDWVRRNREIVHRETDGQIGYVHIPDMGATGYSEFHRSYVSEKEKDGFIIDVRFNGGGNVSQLILEKLARKRLGYTVRRWGVSTPYPADSIEGPLVALTNAYAGSDGDIFSHCFKLMDLGPLLGTRTWGGVVGIWPRHALVDGSVTTQPEFSFWFNDVGFDVENYGTDPDMEIELPPGEWDDREDRQLHQAIEEAMERLEEAPDGPDLDDYPSLAPPDEL